MHYNNPIAKGHKPKEPAMYTIPPKKMLIINILDILRRYTDAEHTLTQREIVDLLESEYQMSADRKSVKRNLMNLMDFGYDIEYSEIERTGKDGKPESMMSGWFMRRDFDDSELRLLVDSLLFSQHIPSRQRRELIGKLERLSNKYFSSRVSHVKALPEETTANRQLFYTVSVLDEAIDKKVKAVFCYGSFDKNGKLHPRLNPDGSKRQYEVDPYQLVATNGRYYLICHMEHADKLICFRVDRVLDAAVLDVPVMPLKKISGYEKGLDLPEHMAEHLYMFADKPTDVRFHAEDWALNHVFDWFGPSAKVEEAKEGGYSVSVRVNEQAMRYWALQFSEMVEILEPQSLRDTLRVAGKEIARKYG
jgi:predicted DNA-binding transcriptional regulator YafY